MKITKPTKKANKQKKQLAIDSNDKLVKLAKEERHNYQSESWKIQTSNGFYNF